MELTITQKIDVIKAMQAYIAEHDTTGDNKTYSQNKLAKDTGVNVAYVDAMVKGCESGEFIFNKVVIKDVYFQRIAEFIGISLQKEYWRQFETEQYLDIEGAFLEAKTGSTVKTVIGSTGTGKTFGAHRMKEKYPTATFIITCANDYNLRDFMRYIAGVVGIKDSEYLSQVKARTAIQKRLKSLFDEGFKPILIFDEAENLTLPALGRVKALYDNLKGVAAFLLFGTPNWFRKMKTQRDKERDIAPQIFRRFLSGNKTVHLNEMSSSDVREICTEIGVNDKYVINHICGDVYNYGDLSDTLISLQRAADAQGCPVNRALYENEYKQCS